MTLRDLKPGETARVTVVGGEGALRLHFLDMGVIPGAEITLVKYAPMGIPWNYWGVDMSLPFGWMMQPG